MSNSSNFDGTAPLGWSLLKADIESTAFVKGWKSEQKLQTLVSRITGKTLKFYKNRSYTVQADYETLCKLFNDRFDSVGYPLLILENLNNILPYPDELLDEFTDRIEELAEGAFQNETENVKEHLIIKYLTNACCDEEGKELVKAVAEDSVYEAKRYLCTFSKITAKRYLKLKSLWEHKMKNGRDDINLKIEKTGDHDLIVRSQGTDEIVDSEKTTRTVNNDELEYYTPSKHLNEVERNGTMERKRTGTNLKIEKTEDHCSVMIGQKTEQTAHEGETIEKESNPVIEYYTTPCHLKDVKEDAVYTMESPSPEYETDWLGEADDIRQTEESPSPNYKPDAICEADEKGQKIPTNSHCFNEQKRDCDTLKGTVFMSTLDMASGAGKKHINADGLSRIPDDIEACRNYRPDVNLEELPCGGCKFCTRARQQWQTFEEEVDFVVPLTIRRLVDDDSYNTNWTPSYSPVELHEEQMKDSDLKTLKRWIDDKYEPTKAELKLCSEVVRHVWSLRQQIQIKDNILLYKWEDPISPRLLFMTPKQMQNELLHGCHDVVSSGTSNWNADRKEVPQYIKDLVENFKKVHDIARDNLKACQERQKGIYDLKYNQNIYNVGDVVYKLNQATQVGQSGKLKSPWKGPYLITAWRSPVLYKIKDRKTESWIYHDRIKLCEDRELPIWIKRMRNQLMDQTMDEETNEMDECTLGLPDIFKENTNVMSSSDPLMSHFIGDAAIVSAPDPLVSRIVSNSNSFDPASSSENKGLTDMCEKNINGDLHVHEMDATGVESDILCRRRQRKKPAYLSDYVED
ncbi:unnamed protein product [Mytilus coruscus]|uniref:Uncharacterized protein n=1 Tax=Mytilus coruscus TaxID=42192 RepID=A0A6J7ZX81_MYTCO|nr:unnamed protein product [Mytilus coruscus]